MLFLLFLQLNCAESCPGGPDASQGQLRRNAVAVAVATPKRGQTKPERAQDDGCDTV